MVDHNDVRERAIAAALLSCKALYRAITGVDELTDGRGFVPVAVDAAFSVIRPGDKLPGTPETGSLMVVPIQITPAIEAAWSDGNSCETAEGDWSAMLAAAKETTDG